MVKYVEGNFNEDYIQTLGVNFMEKTIALRNTDITFSIWDLGGQQEYLHMLPLVCNDAVALLFMFDLSRKSTLTSVKNWYKQARLLNKTATPFLIGTKYDYFSNLKPEEKKEMTLQARRFAKAMKAPLIFCSASHAINIHKIFKVVLAKVFDLKCTVQQITNIGDPIIEYEQSATATDDGGADGGSTQPAGQADGAQGSTTGEDDKTSGEDAGETGAAAGAAHRKNNSSVSSVKSTASNSSGPTLPVAGRHQTTQSIGGTE
jgi:GTP-binding protein of the ras superfamily involved in termination of M-phase